MSKTIWLNLDSTKVDVTYLDDFFEKKGWTLLKEPIPTGDEEKTVEMARK